MKFKIVCLWMSLLAVLPASRLYGQAITSFTPVVGSTNDQIIVYGTGFDTGGINIYFSPNNTLGTKVGETTTSVTVLVPNGAQTGPLSVRRNTGPIIPFTLTNFTVISRAPWLTGLSPLYGDTNTTVTITGYHLTNSPLAAKPGFFFGGVLASNINPYGDGMMLSANPARTTPRGPVTITVTNIYGSAATNGFYLAGPEPYVAEFSPPQGTPGDPITLTGLHFTGTTSVRFDGILTSFLPPVMDTALTVHVPTGAISGPITVSNAFGGYTTVANFGVPPQVIGFSPTNGRPGTNVIITGSSLNGATSVTFNGLAATILTNTSTNITAVVPAGATTGFIQVFTPAGNTPSATRFFVQPTLTGTTPTAGAVGTPVAVTGDNLSGLQSVRFNGTTSGISNATPTTFNTAVPAGATTGPVSITTTNGSHTNGLFYVNGSITSVSPTNGPEDTLVTIGGNNFTGATAVSFNGTPAQSFGVSNNTTLGAVAPGGVITGPISITTPAGTFDSGSRLFYGSPSIFSFQPGSGLPGTNVVITGTNFLGATSVKFNGLTAPSPAIVHNGRIEVAVPSGATTGPITVIGPSGSAVSATDFVVNYASDIAVSVSATPNPVFVGSNLTYTIIVTNAGPLPAPNMRWTNTLPASRRSQIGLDHPRHAQDQRQPHQRNVRNGHGRPGGDHHAGRHRVLSGHAHQPVDGDERLPRPATREQRRHHHHHGAAPAGPRHPPLPVLPQLGRDLVVVSPPQLRAPIQNHTAGQRLAEHRAGESLARWHPENRARTGHPPRALLPAQTVTAGGIYD